MIAEIQPSFSSHLSMSRKIEYQLSKVKEGNGKRTGRHASLHETYLPVE